MKPHASRLDLTVYPHQVEVQSRFADVDPLWHLNNVRLVELYQDYRRSGQDGYAAQVAGTIGDITGRQPISLDEALDDELRPEAAAAGRSGNQ